MGLGLLVVLLVVVGAVLLLSAWMRRGTSSVTASALLGAAVGLVLVYALVVSGITSVEPDLLVLLIGLLGAGVGAAVWAIRRRIEKEAGAEPPKRGSPASDRSSAAPEAGGPEDAALNLFLSYRRDDVPDAAGRIYDRLAEHFGAEHVFKDVDSIPFGVDFREHLDAMVKRADVLLVVIGPRWAGGDGSRLHASNDFVRIEVERALARGISVVPLLVRGATLPAEDALPASLQPLRYRQGAEVRSDPDFHRDMDRLLASLGRG